MDPEDLEPRKQTVKPKDLDVMGVEELNDYLAGLESEVARVKAKIESKKAYLSGAGSFFKSYSSSGSPSKTRSPSRKKRVPGAKPAPEIVARSRVSTPALSGETPVIARSTTSARICPFSILPLRMWWFQQPSPKGSWNSKLTLSPPARWMVNRWPRLTG